MSMVHPLSMRSNSVGSQLSKQSQRSISVMLQGTKVNHQLQKAGSMERLERLALTPLHPLGLHRCCHSASESTIGCSWDALHDDPATLLEERPFKPGLTSILQPCHSKSMKYWCTNNVWRLLSILRVCVTGTPWCTCLRGTMRTDWTNGDEAVSGQRQHTIARLFQTYHYSSKASSTRLEPWTMFSQDPFAEIDCFADTYGNNRRPQGRKDSLILLAAKEQNAGQVPKFQRVREVVWIILCKPASCASVGSWYPWISVQLSHCFTFIRMVISLSIMSSSYQIKSWLYLRLMSLKDSGQWLYTHWLTLRSLSSRALMGLVRCVGLPAWSTWNSLRMGHWW